MDAAAELGRDAVSKHQIQPEDGDEQADTGRDCLTRLPRPNLRRERKQGNIHFPGFADHEQDWQPYPVGPYSCTIHTRFFSTNIVISTSVTIVSYN